MKSIFTIWFGYDVLIKSLICQIIDLLSQSFLVTDETVEPVVVLLLSYYLLYLAVLAKLKLWRLVDLKRHVCTICRIHLDHVDPGGIVQTNHDLVPSCEDDPLDIPSEIYGLHPLVVSQIID